MKKIFTMIITLFLLTSCATQLSATSPISPQPVAISWSQRSAQLSRLNHWMIVGAVSIRQPQRTTMASLQWEQRAGDYDIRLAGPLSVGGVHISGGMGHVTLTGVQKGTVETATSPEALMQQQLGVVLPISNMYYWVRGIPAPGIPSKQQLDAQNHLTTLQQQTWTIQYLAYQTVRGIDLPRMILMTQPGVTVKLVIKQWLELGI